MKKIFLLLSINILILQSCSSDGSSITNNNATSTKIYFDAYDNNVGGDNGKYSEIYSINLDGSGQQRITNYSSNGSLAIITEEPILNQDGSKIYFSSDKDNPDGESEIFKINIDGLGLTNVTYNSGNNFKKPTLIENGTKLLMEKHGFNGTNKYGEIYSANIDGTNQINLTNYLSDGNCYDPTYNSNNNTVIYSRNSSTTSINYQIWTMSVNGSNKQQLTANDGISKRNAKISPDGTKIIFEGSTSAMLNKQSEIFIMNFDGTNIVQLTNYSNNGSLYIYTKTPVFSKNGDKVYYTSSVTGVSQIYVMNIDGSNKTQLTTSPEEKSNPVLN